MSRPRPAGDGPVFGLIDCPCGQRIQYEIVGVPVASQFRSMAEATRALPGELVAHMLECRSLSGSDKALLREWRGADA